MQQSRDMLLILLIGTNPLPNYLSACALKPKRIAFIYTQQTQKAMHRLKKKLKQELPGCDLESECKLTSASDPVEMQAKVRSLRSCNPQERICLSYTGGTKVMAVHAHLALREAAGNEPMRDSAQDTLADFFYLDDGGSDGPRLCFDNGDLERLAIAELGLDLPTVLDLHGMSYKVRPKIEPAPTTSDAQEIASKVLSDLELAKCGKEQLSGPQQSDTEPLLDRQECVEEPLSGRLYQEKKRLCGDVAKADIVGFEVKSKRNPKALHFLTNPFEAKTFGLDLSQPVVPTEEQLQSVGSSTRQQSWFKQWYKFIGGGWLEDWVAELICSYSERIGIDPTTSISVGFEAFRAASEAPKGNGHQIEIDIAVIKDCRTYFISCTTDPTKSVCKAKIFEIAVRAQQLGGDLARAALVCLAGTDTLKALRREVDDDEDDTNSDQQQFKVAGVGQVKVFGCSDVKTWAGHGGKTANVTSLIEWLKN